MTEFTSWKEREEDATYTTYIKNQQAYKPSSSGEFVMVLSIPVILLVYQQTEIKTRYYFVCCRSGKHCINKHQRKIKEVHPHQKESRNSIPHVYHDFMLMNMEMATPLSHIFQYIPMGWIPVSSSICHSLRAPNEVAMKISLGGPTERILDGNTTL